MDETARHGPESAAPGGGAAILSRREPGLFTPATPAPVPALWPAYSSTRGFDIGCASSSPTVTSRRLVAPLYTNSHCTSVERA